MRSPPCRVLYVDNDEDTCEMITLLLDSHGIKVTCVKSAADATVIMGSERYDLLLLDVCLPDLDGLEFCRELRRSDLKTPIFFYSGAAYASDISKGLAAGANGYVVKPDIEGLLQVVLTALEMPVADEIRRERSLAQRVPARGSLADGYFRVRAASH